MTDRPAHDRAADFVDGFLDGSLIAPLHALHRGHPFFLNLQPGYGGALGNDAAAKRAPSILLQAVQSSGSRRLPRRAARKTKPFRKAVDRHRALWIDSSPPDVL